MNDEEILELLADAASEKKSEEDSKFRSLDSLCRGAITREDQKRLRDDVRARHGDTDLYDACRPFGAAELAGFVDAIADQQQSPHATDGMPEQRDNVVLLRSRWPRRLVWAAAPLAAAAALALFLRFAADPKALPPYVMEVSGGSQAYRSEPSHATEVLRLPPGSRFSLTLRPQTTVDRPVEAHVFVVEADEARRVQLPVQTSELKAMRIAATVEDLGLKEPAVLAVVVGDPASAVPRAEEIAKAARDREQTLSGWQLFWRRIDTTAE
jgi:hypothetical protein